MLARSRELIYALAAILFFTVLYLLAVALFREVPAASSLYGHGMSIFGFVLMLMTETLYSLRKRISRANWGRMSSWLEFHIFTGLVGPYLVLLHSSWKFNGLAGVVMLLTVMIVISGVIGRYIYTAVPRSLDGVELGLAEIDTQMKELEASLNKSIPAFVDTLPSASLDAPLATPPGRTGAELIQALRRLRAQKRLQPEARKNLELLETLSRQRQQLIQKAGSLVTARRLLAIWHAVHIPLGLTLFIMAFIHIGGAIYYATLLR